MSRRYYIPLILAFLILLFWGNTLTWILTHHYELKKSALDGALFLQLIHFINADGVLYNSIHPTYIAKNWLGFHFSPILYLLYPFYLLFPTITFLYVVHTLLIALAAIPIFFVCQKLLGNGWYALVCAALYLLNPMTINAAIWDFHEIAFAPLIIACLAWALLNYSKTWAIIFSLLLLCVKEHYGLSIIGLGIAWAWMHKDYRFAAALVMLGIMALALILGVAMPYFSPTDGIIFMNTDTGLASHKSINRFGWISNPFGEGSPLFGLILTGFEYVAALLFVFFFFPVLAFPLLLIASADLAANILSTNDMMRSPFSYHSAAIIPMLVIATAYALRHNKTLQKDKEFWLGSVVALSLWASYTSAAIPLNASANVWEFTTPKLRHDAEDKKALADIALLIPRNASVSAQNNVIPHLETRSNLFHFPDRYEDADYVVLHTGLIFKKTTSAFSDPYSWRSYFEYVDKVMHSNEWGVVFYKHHWLVMQKGAKTNSALKQKAITDFNETEKSMQAISDKTNQR